MQCLGRSAAMSQKPRQHNDIFLSLCVRVGGGLITCI